MYPLLPLYCCLWNHSEGRTDSKILALHYNTVLYLYLYIIVSSPMSWKNMPESEKKMVIFYSFNIQKILSYRFKHIFSEFFLVYKKDEQRAKIWLSRNPQLTFVKNILTSHKFTRYFGALYVIVERLFQIKFCLTVV